MQPRKLQIVKVTARPKISFWKWLWLEFVFYTAPYKLMLIRASVFTSVCMCAGGIMFTLLSSAPSSKRNTDMPYNIAKAVPSEELVPWEPQEKVRESPEIDDRAPAAAPKIPMGKSNPEAYIKKYAAIAQAGWKQYKVPASISLAQGLIESRAGLSKLAVGNNNHFGMKCFSRNCKKGHCTNHTDDTHKDFFLKFKTAFQSWDAHAKLLASGRYAKLKKYGKDYRRWAQGLKSCGYATDRTYAQKLIGIIENYNLDRYDR